jgi:hypothetical protein
MQASIESTELSTLEDSDSLYSSIAWPGACRVSISPFFLYLAEAQIR